MISLEVRKEFVAAIKKLVETFDHPAYTVNYSAGFKVMEGIHEECVQPYRIFFSRDYDPKRKQNVRTLSFSWIGGQPFSGGDLPEVKAIIEEAIGTTSGRCGFAFTDQRRIYHFW